MGVERSGHDPEAWEGLGAFVRTVGEANPGPAEQDYAGGDPLDRFALSGELTQVRAQISLVDELHPARHVPAGEKDQVGRCQFCSYHVRESAPAGQFQVHGFWTAPENSVFTIAAKVELSLAAAPTYAMQGFGVPIRRHRRGNSVRSSIATFPDPARDQIDRSHSRGR